MPFSVTPTPPGVIPSPPWLRGPVCVQKLSVTRPPTGGCHPHLQDLCDAMEGPSRPRAPTLDTLPSARNHVLGAAQRPLRSGRPGPRSVPALQPPQSAPRGQLPPAAARFPSPRSAPPGCLSVGGQRQPRRGALPFKTRVPEAVPRQRRYRKWMRRQLRAAGRESSSPLPGRRRCRGRRRRSGTGWPGNGLGAAHGARGAGSVTPDAHGRP